MCLYDGVGGGFLHRLMDNDLTHNSLQIRPEPILKIDPIFNLPLQTIR